MESKSARALSLKQKSPQAERGRITTKNKRKLEQINLTSVRLTSRGKTEGKREGGRGRGENWEKSEGGRKRVREERKGGKEK